MKLSELKLDDQLVDEGAWFPYGEDGAAFKIASMNKKAYRNKLGRLMTRAVTANRNNPDIPQVKRDEIIDEAMVGTIIMGWKGWQEDDDSDIAFTEDNARRFLQTGQVRDFIQRMAGNDENFKPKKGENAEGGWTPEARLKSGLEVPLGAGPDAAAA